MMFEEKRLTNVYLQKNLAIEALVSLLRSNHFSLKIINRIVLERAVPQF